MRTFSSCVGLCGRSLTTHPAVAERALAAEREFSAIFRLSVPCPPLLLKFMGYFVAACYDVMLLCSYWLMRHRAADPECVGEPQSVLKAPNSLI